MQYFYNKAAILLLVSSALTLFSSVDADCDSEFASLADNPALCDEVDGACPSSCNVAVDSLHTTCSMDGATFNGQTIESSYVLLIAIHEDLAIGACEEMILEKLLTFANTCQEITTLNVLGSVLQCRDDSEQCSKFCMDMLDGFYATCRSDDTFEDRNSVTGVDTNIADVLTAEMFLKFNFMSKTCRVYQDTLDFTDGGSVDNDYDNDSVDDDFLIVCELKFIFLLESCNEVDGVCPSTCNDAVNRHTTCSMDGATFYDSIILLLITTAI